MLIHAMFTDQARRTPDAVAVVDHANVYTYRELDELTDALACRLQEAGIGPESVVGCWSHTSASTVIQVLSVLKAGGAYLLLDPNLPIERLRYMVGDAGPVCLFGDQQPPDSVAGDRTVLLMGDTARPATGGPQAGVAPDNLAYVAYTSGSTGRPKGVLITHAAVTHHAESFCKLFDLGPGDRLPLMAPIAFDMATEEMLPPLVSGCTLIDAHLPSPTMEEFTADVLTNGYTILNLPAPLWHHWTTYLRDTGGAVPPALRLVIAGSDKIYTNLLQEWLSLPGAEKVWWVAAYGVTEATVTTLLYLTAAQDDLGDELLVPIGTPFGAVTVYVVREDGELAAPEETGELYIAGAGLARGYHCLPEKTAACFVDNAFDPTAGPRCYRSGDLVRRRADGSIVFLGRQDSQIKINGLRIEPTEIEAIIHEYPPVGDAIVVFTPPTAAGETGNLTAYVEAEPDHLLDAEELASFLRARLHPLMVPGRIVLLDEIPLNANGKPDRKGLESKTFQQV